MAKRGHFEGSLYKRADGRWSASVSLGGGRRKYVYAPTRLKAASKLTELLKAVKDNAPLPSDRLTVKDFSMEWLEGVKTSRRPRTFELYESIMRVHLVPSLGRMSLTRLEPRHLQNLYREMLAKGLSPVSVRNYHARIGTMLSRAVKLGTIIRNPASLVDLPAIERREMVMFSTEEARRFVEAAHRHRLGALFLLAITSGARQGELLGATWSNIDIDRRQLRVQRSLQRMNGRFNLVEPKTPSSKRTIALTEIAAMALRRHRARQMEESLKVGPAWRNDMDLVFTTTVGTPIEKTNLIRRQFRPFLRETGLDPTLHWHDLRHVAATLALSQGMSIPDVAAMLGHSSPATTMRVYAHAVPGGQRKVADAMDALLAV